MKTFIIFILALLTFTLQALTLNSETIKELEQGKKIVSGSKKDSTVQADAYGFTIQKNAPYILGQFQKFEQYPKIMPQIKSTLVTAQDKARRICTVNFCVILPDLPFIPDEDRYVLEYDLSKTNIISWTLKSSSFFEKLDGLFEIIPSSNGNILHYRNIIKIKKLSSFLMVDTVKEETVEALDDIIQFSK